jgi:hypothetical protein
MERCKCLSNNKNIEKYLDDAMPFLDGKMNMNRGKVRVHGRDYLGTSFSFNIVIMKEKLF